MPANIHALDSNPSSQPTSQPTSRPTRSDIPTKFPTPTPTFAPSPTGYIGYYVSSTYGSDSCVGTAKSTVYSLGTCIYSSSKASFMYFNYKYISSGMFQLPLRTYSSPNCTGSFSQSDNNFVVTSCQISSASTNKWYSDVFPVLSGGVIARSYNSMTSCDAKVRQSTSVVLPYGWCNSGGPLSSFEVISCNETHFQLTAYSDTSCLSGAANYTLQNGLCSPTTAGALSYNCSVGYTPTLMPTRPPTVAPTSRAPTPAPTTRAPTPIPTFLPTAVPTRAANSSSDLHSNDSTSSVLNTTNSIIIGVCIGGVALLICCCLGWRYRHRHLKRKDERKRYLYQQAAKANSRANNTSTSVGSDGPDSLSSSAATRPGLARSGHQRHLLIPTANEEDDADPRLPVVEQTSSVRASVVASNTVRSFPTSSGGANSSDVEMGASTDLQVPKNTSSATIAAPSSQIESPAAVIAGADDSREIEKGPADRSIGRGTTMFGRLFRKHKAEINAMKSNSKSNPSTQVELTVAAKEPEEPSKEVASLLGGQSDNHLSAENDPAVGESATLAASSQSSLEQGSKRESADESSESLKKQRELSKASLEDINKAVALLDRGIYAAPPSPRRHSHSGSFQNLRGLSENDALTAPSQQQPYSIDRSESVDDMSPQRGRLLHNPSFVARNHPTEQYLEYARGGTSQFEMSNPYLQRAPAMNLYSQQRYPLPQVQPVRRRSHVEQQQRHPDYVGYRDARYEDIYGNNSSSNLGRGSVGSSAYFGDSVQGLPTASDSMFSMFPRIDQSSFASRNVDNYARTNAVPQQQHQSIEEQQQMTFLQQQQEEYARLQLLHEQSRLQEQQQQQYLRQQQTHTHAANGVNPMMRVPRPQQQQHLQQRQEQHPQGYDTIMPTSTSTRVSQNPADARNMYQFHHPSSGNYTY